MITREIKFELGVSRVFAVGKSPDNVVQGLEGLLGHLLVAADIGDLNVI
jgi:hypothetical protein